MAAALTCTLILVGAGLAQLRPDMSTAMAAAPSAADTAMQMDMSGQGDMGIPSYHAYALKPPYPATLDPKQFPDPLNRNVYALAGKIRPVLYQQPCYCYCDRHAGAQELARLFRRHARRGVRRLPEGSGALLPAHAKGKDSRADSRGDYPRRLARSGLESVYERRAAVARIRLLSFRTFPLHVEYAALALLGKFVHALARLKAGATGGRRGRS